MAIHRFVATIGETTHEVTVEAGESPGRFTVSVDGRAREVDARRVEAATWSLVPPGGGAARLVDVDGRGGEYVAGIAGQSFALKLVEGRRAAVAAVATKGRHAGPVPVRAPMPGKIVKVLVAVGEAVKAGQGLLVMEAMKMENELKAPRDATVSEIGCAEGQPVEAGQVLLTLG